MSNNNDQRLNLDEIVAQRTDALGGEDIEFDWHGEKFTMPHPVLADDDWKLAMRDAGEDEIAIAEGALGDKQYQRFRELGGRAAYISFLVQHVMEEVQGEMGGNPTPSSTSSARTRKRSKRT